MVPHYAVREGETIRYCDIMSQYPFACKYSKFPVGNPEVHVGDACRDIQAMLCKEGLAKCTVLPPKRRYHPDLPLHCNSKLLYRLCRTRAFECKFSGECAHESTGQSSLTSMWVLDEVRLIIQKGYEVLDIMEVYEHEVTKYDTHTRDCGLFAEYINTFLKLNPRLAATLRGFETTRTRNVMSRPSMLEKAC